MADPQAPRARVLLPQEESKQEGGCLYLEWDKKDFQCLLGDLAHIVKFEKQTDLEQIFP